ncbi:MAG: glutamate racemase [Flavobacteriaceae bacterium]
MNNQPIGIFDSGVGGTSIWKEIHTLLPNEDTIYLADSKNAPYGHKSQKEIQLLSVKNTEKLISLGSKIIVVACNTATTNAIDFLRKTYDIPFIGIEPAIKPAALKTKTKQIGILATKGTLKSSLFTKTSELYANQINVIEVIGEGLVPIVENNLIDKPETLKLLQKFLEPMIEANIDYLVLGCSHYPYLVPQIKKLLPENVVIIDSGRAVARQTKAVLENNNLLETKRRKPNCHFFTNSKSTSLSTLLKDYENEISMSFLSF